MRTQGRLSLLIASSILVNRSEYPSLNLTLAHLFFRILHFFQTYITSVSKLMFSANFLKLFLHFFIYFFAEATRFLYSIKSTVLHEHLHFLSAAFLRRVSLVHSSFHHGTGFLCCLTLAVFGEGLKGTVQSVKVQFEIASVITFKKKIVFADGIE